jgi:hypothetical protein
LAVPTCSRNCQLQVSERRSGNWILESRQGASNRGLRPMPDVSSVVALPYGVGRSYPAVCPANVSNARDTAKWKSDALSQQCEAGLLEGI